MNASCGARTLVENDRSVHGFAAVVREVGFPSLDVFHFEGNVVPANVAVSRRLFASVRGPIMLKQLDEHQVGAVPQRLLRVNRNRAIRRWCGSMSFVPRKRPNRRHVANDAKGQRATLRTHSITSSASNCIELGTSMPRALAVLRLMTKSNFFGCSIGRSLGLVPRRILINVVGCAAIQIRNVWSIRQERSCSRSF